MTDTSATTKVSRPGVGARIAALTSAGLLALLAVGLLAAGGVLLWADSRKDEQGYFSTGTDRFSTGTYALATEELDVDADVPGWLLDRDRYGQVRLRVTPNEGKPVFVGIAPTQDVERYLARTQHTTVTDLDYAPFHVDYRDHAGQGPSTPPSRQDFWTASAQGSDTQTVRWDVEQGSWTVVVMNADGSAGVDAGISAGAKVPFLAPVGWGVLGGGVLILLAAGALLVVGARPSRPRPEAPLTAAVA